MLMDLMIVEEKRHMNEAPQISNTRRGLEYLGDGRRKRAEKNWAFYQWVKCCWDTEATEDRKVSIWFGNIEIAEDFDKS